MALGIDQNNYIRINKNHANSHNNVKTRMPSQTKIYLPEKASSLIGECNYLPCR
jgi:hypothetical protein